MAKRSRGQDGAFDTFLRKVRARDEALPDRAAAQANFRGLLGALKGSFYPHYIHVMRGRSSSSLERGSEVDAQIYHFVTHGTWPPGLARVDPYAQAAMDALTAAEYTPLAAQVRLYDESTRITTYADIMGVHAKSGKIFLAELKTGFEAGYYVGSPTQRMLEPPLQDIRASCASQHHLQVGMMADICERKYGLDPKWGDRCFVLLVNRKGARIIPLKPWFRARKQEIVAKLIPM